MSDEEPTREEGVWDPATRAGTHKAVRHVVDAAAAASGVPDSAGRARSRRLVYTLAWIGFVLVGLTAAVPIALIPHSEGADAVILFKAVALAATILALLAAIVTMAAHKRSDEWDFFAKILGFGSALVAAIAAVILFQVDLSAVILPIGTASTAPATPSCTPAGRFDSGC